MVIKTKKRFQAAYPNPPSYPGAAAGTSNNPSVGNAPAPLPTVPYVVGTAPGGTPVGFDTRHPMAQQAAQQGGGAPPPAGAPGGAYVPTGDPTTDLAVQWSGATGQNPMGGFAGQFNPLALNELNPYYNPEQLLPYVFPNMDLMGPGFAMLANQPFDPYTMWMLFGGAGTMSGLEDYTNWVPGFYQGLNGGGWYNPGDILGALMSPSGSLGGLLDAFGPQQDLALYQGALGAAAQAMHPLMAQAFSQAIPGMLAGIGRDSGMLTTPPAEMGLGWGGDTLGMLAESLRRLGLPY